MTRFREQSSRIQQVAGTFSKKSETRRLNVRNREARNQKQHRQKSKAGRPHSASLRHGK